MRILHISTRLILGGSQENTVLSCEGQARRGHDVHLAFGPIYGPEGSLLGRVQAFHTIEGRGISTYEVPDLVREVSPAKDRRAYTWLRRLIEQLAPDVVHTHSSKAGIVGREAAWHARPANGRRPAIVHTIHGPPFMPVEGWWLARARTRVLNYEYTLAERWAAARCDVIVSVADAMTAEFLRRRIGRPDLYTTVRSGIDISPYVSPPPSEERGTMRQSLGLQDGDFVIGTVARLAQHKGHDDLLEALGDRLRADRRWKLLWVGDGWWRQRLAARVHSMGLQHAELDRPPARQTVGSPGGVPASSIAHASVIFRGMVTPEAVPGLIRAMDVLAHPSSREGLPRTVPQALLCGVCPVAYDADGTREACIDGLTGRLVAVGDANGLREAIEFLYDHPHERYAMAERGRERCRDEFDAERMVSRLDDVYQRAIESARRA